MKVYSTKTKEKKDKKNLMALIIGIVLIACAIIITLCVTLSGQTQDVGGNVVPPVNEQTEKYVMPMEQFTLGQGFSDDLVFNQTLEQWRTHNGVDFIAEKGTKVMAILGGKVVDVENTTLEGTVVTIEQSDGVIAIYKSLSSEVSVKSGDTVKAGDVIGKVDVTMSTEKKVGAHLHLEMKKNGEFISPLDYLPYSSDK